MTKEIKTSIVIQAKPEKVWEVFSNFEKYNEWNPLIKSIKGEIKEGNKIKVQVSKKSFKARVMAYTPNKELVWSGGLFIKGLFDGEHRFIFKYNGRGTTLFEHSEEFSGLLVKSFSNKIDTEIKDSFEEMNKNLKQLVEDKFPYKKWKPRRKKFYKKPFNSNKKNN